jgi:6-phosphogluconolactonase (cycloisomerase 2 family)
LNSSERPAGTRGHWPRQFAIVSDPGEGELMYVANQCSGTVVALRVDPGTNMPAPVPGVATEVPDPICVLLTDWHAPSA